MMTVSFNYDTFMTADYGPCVRGFTHRSSHTGHAQSARKTHTGGTQSALRQRRHNLLRKRRADAGHLC